MATRESPKRQELGPKKYRKMIDDNMKKSRDNPNMLQPVRKSLIKSGFKQTQCPYCDRSLLISKYTCLVECSGCKKLVTVADD